MDGLTDVFLTPRQTEAVHALVRDELSSGGRVCMRIATGSMRPMAVPGDEIEIERCRLHDLSLGDIILWEADGCFYTHRFLSGKFEEGRPMILAKGDNSTVADRSFPADRLIGRAVAVHRGPRTINLENLFWKGVNRLLGAVSLAQESAFRLARRVKHKIFIIG